MCAIWKLRCISAPGFRRFSPHDSMENSEEISRTGKNRSLLPFSRPLHLACSASPVPPDRPTLDKGHRRYTKTLSTLHPLLPLTSSTSYKTFSFKFRLTPPSPKIRLSPLRTHSLSPTLFSTMQQRRKIWLDVSRLGTLMQS